jgi:cysteine desulfurase
MAPTAPALVYLDHAATTPMRPEAIAAMLPYLDGQFANPSGSHRFARQARHALDEARETVAGVVGCRAGEVVFTAGGTEADNAAILGAVRARPGLAVCSAAEHHAVLHAVEQVHGAVVGVDATGCIDLEQLSSALTAATGPVTIVSAMAVNNEVGSITDVAAVAAAVRRHAPGGLVHTDAVQAAAWLDLAQIWRDVDLLSLAAHKFGGPKGVGVLAVREGTVLEPLLVGGGQERERRSGTQNVAGAVAMAEALRLAAAEREVERTRLGALRDLLVDGIVGALDDVRETVPRHRKVAGSAHLCILGVENEALLYLLDEAGVCASAASACAAGAMEPSHVLAAMGIERPWGAGALRLTLGRASTSTDVAAGIEAVVAAVRRIRAHRAQAATTP